MASTLHLFLLGSWQVHLNGVALPALPTRHARALLARLVLAHPTPVARNTLLTDLFPHSSAEEATQHLRTTLFYLRRALGDGVHSAGAAIALDPTWMVVHDVERFEQNTALTATEEALHAAITLYRGPFLDNQGDGWAAVEAQRLHACYLQALRRVVAVARGGGRITDALLAAQRWADEEPWDEPAHLAVIEALLVRGEEAAAAVQVARARSLLRVEWNQAPSETFEALARTVGRQPAEQGHPRPLPLSPSSINLDAWERLPLVGRHEELARLRTAWSQARQGTPQAMLVMGPVGIGKSRLVQEFIAQVRLRAETTVLEGRAHETTPGVAWGLLRYALRLLTPSTAARLTTACTLLDDACWSVVATLPELQALLPTRTPSPLPQVTAEAERNRCQAALVCLFDRVAQHHPLLLIWENVHQADPESLALAQTLTSSPRRVLVVATQRSASQSVAEHWTPIMLAPLQRPAVATLLQHALDSPTSVGLEDYVWECSRGNPLALCETLRVLHAQGSLHRSPGEGWHLTHDEAVPASDGLLLKARLGLHGCIPQVLAQGNREAAEAMLHAAAAEEWTEALHLAESIARCAVEQGQLAASKEAVEIAEQAMDALGWDAFDARRWELLRLKESYLAQADRGPAWTEALQFLQAYADANGYLEWRVEAKTRHGRALRDQGQPAAAETVLREAVALAQARQLVASAAQALDLLAAVLEDRGAPDQARAASAQAVAAADQSGDDVLRLRTRATHAYMLMRSDLVPEADQLLTEILREPVLDAQPVLHARLVRQHGIIKMAARQYSVGFDLLREAVRRTQAVGEVQGMLIAQTSLFYELTRFGLYREGWPLGEATLTLARHLNARTQQAALLNLLAVTYYRSGNVQEALPLAEESAQLAESLGLPEYAADSWGLVADIALTLADLPQAQRAIVRVEALLAPITLPTVNIHHIVARVWLQLGQLTQARTHAQQAVARVADTGLTAIEMAGVLWQAAAVLAQVDGPLVTAPLQQRAYERFLDDLLRLDTPLLRQAWVTANAAHRALAAFRGKGVRRLVFLPLADAPKGRPLHDDELVPVIWTMDDPGDPMPVLACRKVQVQRLVGEAWAQGASPTVEALAEALGVVPRTVQRVIKNLRRQGISIDTRGTPSSRTA